MCTKHRLKSALLLLRSAAIIGCYLILIGTSQHRAHATAIIDLGGNDVGGRFVFENGSLRSDGRYRTGLSFVGDLVGTPEMQGAGFLEFSGVQLGSNPLESGQLAQSTNGGTLSIFDAQMQLLLSGTIGEGSLSVNGGIVSFDSVEYTVNSGSLVDAFVASAGFSLLHQGGLTEQFRKITKTVQVGSRTVQVGTERRQTGTERRQVGTETVQVGTERRQVGTRTVQVGTRTVQVGTETRIINGQPVQVPIFDEVPIFEEKPIFENVPIFDEVPLFEDVPVFTQVPIFEEKPIFETITRHISDGFVLETAFLDGEVRGEAVPEPGSLLLLGLGGSLLGLRRKTVATL